MSKDNPREFAIEIAAQCWCDDRNSSTEMDVDLCQTFAEKLEEQMSAADKLAAALEHIMCEDQASNGDYNELGIIAKYALKEYRGESD